MGLGVSVLRAETKSSIPVPAQVELKFTVFGTRTFKGLAYRVGNSSKVTPLKFYSVTLSDVNAYKGDQQIKFYDEVQLTKELELIAAAKRLNPSAPEPQLGIKPVAICSIPNGMKNAVLLFFPRSAPAADGIQCEVFPMDMSVTKVPAGSMVIVNASGREFVGQVNSATVKITRGVSEPYKAENGRIAVKIARVEPEFQNVVSGDRWVLGETQRRIWVLFPYSNTSDALPDARCLVDRLPVEEKGLRTALLSP
ncbi:hypothetical protein RAHE111665_07055 [Rariglobus hedericola]